MFFLDEPDKRRVFAEPKSMTIDRMLMGGGV